MEFQNIGYITMIDLSLLSKVHSEFYAYCTCSKPEEDGLRCTPRSLRGNGGVSILWHKTLQPYVQKLTDVSTERVVGIRLVTADRPICFLSVYLPTRTGCTDDFKECMDYLDAVLGRLAFDNGVVIMGDFNADTGSEGGPLSSTPTNEQGRILLRYLQRWNYLSVHLYNEAPGLSQSVTHTYCSEAHNTSAPLITYSLPSICCPTFLTPLYLRKNRLTSQTTHPSAPTSNVSYNLHLCLLPQVAQRANRSKLTRLNSPKMRSLTATQHMLSQGFSLSLYQILVN